MAQPQEMDRAPEEHRRADGPAGKAQDGPNAAGANKDNSGQPKTSQHDQAKPNDEQRHQERPSEPTSKRIKSDNGASGDEPAPAKAAVNLPADVWLMIGHYLRPVELLRLIRVSKPLRLLFTSKRDSGRVWTHAYENAAFPNLVATDWDSIYLANMLHGEPICLVCDESTGQVTRDFENRMLIHDKCRWTIFSTVDEIADQIGNLHDSVLDCVGSLLVKVKSKTLEFFVASQVRAMNDYLRYLDSKTTASRDRDERRQAREARSRFIEDKTKAVDARHDDSAKISVWCSHFSREEEKYFLQQKELRILRRRHDIETRLAELGYVKQELRWLGTEATARKDQTLTDEEWNEISTLLTKKADIARADWIRTDQAKRTADLCQAYHRFFDQNNPGSLNRSLSLSSKRFEDLATVKTLLANHTTIGDPPWNETLPSIERELESLRIAWKLRFARPLASALASAGQPLPQQTVESMYDPNAFPSTPSGWRVNLDCGGNNFDSTTISETVLDELLSRFTSRAFCGYVGGGGTNQRHAIEAHPRIDLERARWHHPSGISVSRRFIEILFAVLKVTGIEDGPRAETEEKIEKLGPIFACRFNACRGSNFVYSQLVSHLSISGHSRALNPHYSEGDFPVSAIVCTLNSPIASASSSS